MIIHVTVSEYLFPLVSYTQGSANGVEWELKEGTTIAEVLNMLNFRQTLEFLVILNNMVYFDRERVLEDGDRLSLLPVIAGG